MTDSLKILGAAALTTSSAEVYKPAAGVTAFVSSFRLVNTSTSAATTCWGLVGPSSTSIIPIPLTIAAGYAYVDSDPMTLASSEAVKFYATPATVDATVFGIEHTT